MPHMGDNPLTPNNVDLLFSARFADSLRSNSRVYMYIASAEVASQSFRVSGSSTAYDVIFFSNSRG